MGKNLRRIADGRGPRLRKSGIAPEPVFISVTSAAAVRAIARHNAIDPRLAPTDRHMQRWAASQGSGLPLDAAHADAMPRRATLPPLPPDEAILTDQVVLRSPDMWRRFIVSWYRSPKPTDVIAQELGISRTTLYEERRIVLAYLLGRLTEAGVSIPTVAFR